MELVVLAALALYGIGCTAVLVAVMASRGRDAGPFPEAPEKLEPPDVGWRDGDAHPAEEIFPIMAEHFPAEYRRYRAGDLGYRDRRRVWDACCAVHDARAEIEELCS